MAAYNKQEVENAIQVLKEPSKHLKPIHNDETGVDYFAYSTDLVRAFELAIEALDDIRKLLV